MHTKYCTKIDTDGDLKFLRHRQNISTRLVIIFYFVAQSVYFGIIGMITTDLRRLIFINNDIFTVVIIALQNKNACGFPHTA